MYIISMCLYYLSLLIDYINPYKSCSKSNYECPITLFDKKKNFYYLALKRENINNSWSIHGLWPQYDSKSYPKYCQNIKFDPTKIKLIIDELNKFWYSTEEKNEDFWCHEWEKHGTCMFDQSDEFEYFKRALSLFVEVHQSDCIKDYPLEKDGLQIKIPFDNEFKIIKPENVKNNYNHNDLDIDLIKIV